MMPLHSSFDSGTFCSSWKNLDIVSALILSSPWKCGCSFSPYLLILSFPSWSSLGFCFLPLFFEDYFASKKEFLHLLIFLLNIKYLYKCSDRSMGSETWNNDRKIDQPIDIILLLAENESHLGILGGVFVEYGLDVGPGHELVVEGQKLLLVQHLPRTKTLLYW